MCFRERDKTCVSIGTSSIRCAVYMCVCVRACERETNCVCQLARQESVAAAVYVRVRACVCACVRERGREGVCAT